MNNYNCCFEIVKSIHSRWKNGISTSALVHLKKYFFAKALSFSVFQDTSHWETNFSSKQLYFQSKIDYFSIRGSTWNSCFFAERFCSEYLVAWSSYFLVTHAYFEHAEHVVFWSSYFLKGGTFSGAGTSWKQSLFLKN